MKAQARSLSSSCSSLPAKQTWLECARWLDHFGIFNSQMSDRLHLNELTLSDLAHTLQDGVVLCKLLNIIAPGCVDSTKISCRTLSRLACLKNIRLFLDACRKEFKLQDEQLFSPDVLYDREIECVLNTLSVLSKLKAAEKACGRAGFDLNANEEEIDLYYNIESIEASDPLYMPAKAILESDDAVYMAFVQGDVVNENDRNSLGRRVEMKLQKRDHNIREIYNTENRYVTTLQSIVTDFVKPLSSVLTPEERKTVFLTLEPIEQLHSRLLTKLNEAINGGKGRTSRVCQAFAEFKQEMMLSYVDAVIGIDAASAKLENLMVTKNGFKALLSECRSEKMKGFQLRDLISLPSQRILKYHVTFADLNKHTDAQHEAKKQVQQVCFNLEYIGHYLNEAKRDHESLLGIEALCSQCPDVDMVSLQALGHLIKDDNVRIKEQGRLMSRSRALFLFDKVLLILKSKADQYSYEDTLSFSEYKLDSASMNINSSALLIVKVRDPTQTLMLSFKNSQQRNEWKTSILNAIDNCSPRGLTNKNHKFELFNFGREIVSCNSCNRELLGIYYQGYKCAKCSLVSHKSCLLKFEECHGGVGFEGASENPNISLALAKLVNKFAAFRVRALHAYQGKPCPPDGLSPLKFVLGDVIQVTDDDDNIWWRGRKGTEEGYFPNNRVKTIENYVEKAKIDTSETVVLAASAVALVKQQPWYEDFDRRETVINILENIANPPEITLFMVRKGGEGGFVVTIKANSIISHLKIYSTHNGKVCLAKEQQFASVNELVDFYRKASLNESFKELDTTLGVPYKEYLALAKPISSAIALYDYIGSETDEIELKENKKYWVLSKMANGWWTIYNSDCKIGCAPGNFLKEQ